MTVLVQWSMFHQPDPGTEWVTQKISEMEYICQDAIGETIASLLAAEWFDDENWEKYFGNDQYEETVWVHIHKPENRVGFYEVHLKRETHGTSEQVLSTDPRHAA